jgi:hypothetical protein
MTLAAVLNRREALWHGDATGVRVAAMLRSGLTTVRRLGTGLGSWSWRSPRRGRALTLDLDSLCPA